MEEKMKQTIIIISALMLTLVIGGPALAETISGGGNTLGADADYTMDDINLSPQVAIDYEGVADSFAMAGWNAKGTRVFACNSADNNIYFQDVPDGDLATNLALTYESWVTAASDDVSADPWKKMGGGS